MPPHACWVLPRPSQHALTCFMSHSLLLQQVGEAGQASLGVRARLGSQKWPKVTRIVTAKVRTAKAVSGWPSLPPCQTPWCPQVTLASAWVHLTLDVSLAITGRLPSTSWYVQPARSRVSTPSLGHENSRTQRGLSPIRDQRGKRIEEALPQGFWLMPEVPGPLCPHVQAGPAPGTLLPPKSYESCSCVGMFLETSVPV